MLPPVYSRPAGSSPRMRGALLGQGQGRQISGIIPADAGSTLDIETGPQEPGDHPRGCGEHISGSMPWMGTSGSSPRMRGARSANAQSAFVSRIIPADAGSTDDEAKPGTQYQDHPRGCGEHMTARPPISIGSGSSPRMRGAQPLRKG